LKQAPKAAPALRSVPDWSVSDDETIDDATVDVDDEMIIDERTL